MNKLVGAIPARHKLASAYPFNIKLNDDPIPANYITNQKKWSVWLNDKYGDCVSAEECANIDAAWDGYVVTDTNLLSWCKKHNLLNGAMLTDVMDLMASDPLTDYSNKFSDGNYLSVDWTNAVLLKAAIYQSKASIKIGVAASQLQNSQAGSEQGWVLTGARKDRNLDHCVGLVGYGTAQFILQALGASVPKGLDPNTQGYALFTWGTVGFIDTQSLVNICGEAWVRNPTSLKNGDSPVPPTPPAPPIPPPPTPIPTPAPTPFDWNALWKIVLEILKALNGGK